MLRQGNRAAEMKFCCSVCLDLLKDPVTAPCGHNYCLSCIKTHWDGEDERGSYSCPQCRQTFTPRPNLVKNTMLAELVEELNSARVQVAPLEEGFYAGPGDVACDVCVGRKLKALSTCLVCLASYCRIHLQPHYDSPAFKRHKVTEPCANLQQNICERHKEVMMLFCRTEQRCICYLCSMETHKGHDTVWVLAERTEQQKQLGARRRIIQQRIRDQEKYVTMLQQETDALDRAADKAVEDNEKTLAELLYLIEVKRNEMPGRIRSRQETEARRIKGLRDELEREIAELKRKDAALEELSHTDDHNHFLHSYLSLSHINEAKNAPTPNPFCLQYFEEVVAALTAARVKIDAILEKKWSLEEPTTRAALLEFSRQITLDPNTVGKNLAISDRDRKVTYDTGNEPHSEHPDRFILAQQVLSKDGLTGQCYWEVEGDLSGVAVAYKSIARSGSFHGYTFGNNKQSWAMYFGEWTSLKHDNGGTLVWPNTKYSRVGVYLDHSAGVLAFYGVPDMILIHRIQTTFTEPLYAGFTLPRENGNTGEICKLRQSLKRQRRR